MKYLIAACFLAGAACSSAQPTAAPPGVSVVVSPMPEPDGKTYQFFGVVDKIHSPNAVVVRYSLFEFPMVIQQMQYPGLTGADYFVVRAAKLPPFFRIGYGVTLSGRYTANADYATVSGVHKTMPVIDLIESEVWTKSHDNIGVPKR
jgi:hypothetical protein